MVDSERFPLSQFELGGAKSQDGAESNGRARTGMDGLISYLVQQLSSAVAGYGKDSSNARNPLQVSSAVAGQSSPAVRHTSEVHDRVAALLTSAVAEHNYAAAVAERIIAHLGLQVHNY